MSLELLLFLALLVTLLAAFTALHCLGEANLLQLTVLLASGFIQLTAGWLLFGFNEGGLLERIHGLLALIPTFMDLKGNLEMSMASRTSTIANTTEHLKTAGGTGGLVLRNMVLMQCQVTVMTLFAVAATAAFVFLRDDQVTLDQVVVLAAIGLITSFVTCTILGKSLGNGSHFDLLCLHLTSLFVYRFLWQAASSRWRSASSAATARTRTTWPPRWRPPAAT